MCLEHSLAYNKCSIGHYLLEKYLFIVYCALCTVQEAMHSAKQSTVISLIELREEWWALKQETLMVVMNDSEEEEMGSICITVQGVLWWFNMFKDI